MSSEAARNTISRWICVAFVIATASALGASPNLAVAKAARVMSAPQQEMATQIQQDEVLGAVAAISIDQGEGAPSSTMPCPMLGGPCVNMASGASHCPPIALFKITGLQAVTPTVVTLGYSRAEFQATGLPAEPPIQPPIL